MRVRSITTVLSFGALSHAGACSQAAPTGGATSEGGSGGIASDAAMPPPPHDGGAAGTDAASSPAVSDATTSFDGDDAPDDTAIPAPDSGSGGSPSYDSGVVRGCASNPNPPDPTAGFTE